MYPVHGQGQFVQEERQAGYDPVENGAHSAQQEKYDQRPGEEELIAELHFPGVKLVQQEVVENRGQRFLGRELNAQTLAETLPPPSPPPPS